MTLLLILGLKISIRFIVHLQLVLLAVMLPIWYILKTKKILLSVMAQQMIR